MGYSSSVGRGSSCGLASTASDSGRAAAGSSTATGGPLRWAQDLRSLLVDLEGLRLFEQFLEQEGAEKHGLYFWFACNGLRSCPEPSVQLQVRAMRNSSVFIFLHYPLHCQTKV